MNLVDRETDNPTFANDETFDSLLLAVSETTEAFVRAEDTRHRAEAARAMQVAKLVLTSYADMCLRRLVAEGIARALATTD